MPMQKNSTLIKGEGMKTSSNVGPKTATINFLKQFARACSYQKTKFPELGKFMAN